MGRERLGGAFPDCTLFLLVEQGLTSDKALKQTHAQRLVHIYALEIIPRI
jgi:hypothetical protein